MKIVIIGSGNVATVLGRLFVKNNHEVIQVVSRNLEHAKVLAAELNCSYCDDSGIINRAAELYLVAVSDGALYSLNNKIHLEQKLVLHTAGSVPKDVLKDISVNYGVLYPLQSLRREISYENDIPLLVDGSSPETMTMIEDFAKTISTNVTQACDEKRLKLHVAAVVVSNFTNHLYALAEDFCKTEDVDFKLLVPLIKETAVRTASQSPAEMQTGPAVRNDVFTLDKHLRILASHPKLKYIYLKLTDSIVHK
ncbi:MAG: DUF2520 domain-containing protein [Ferruginibacter sp.]